jgi:glutathione S-transferase
MKLIGSHSSPYVRKVRIVMAEKKLDYQLVIEDVWGNDAIMKMNPLGKVPCLVMEGQDTITGSVFDSRVIVEYLDTLSPVGKLIPPSGRERVEIRTWEALADGVLDACVAARLEDTWAGRAEGEKPWCSGNHFSLADVCVGCALGYLDFRFAHIDWRTDYPNLARLSEKLGARPSFADTVPK